MSWLRSEPSSRSAAPPAAASPTVVLLRSGEVFQGRVTRQGDRFLVGLPNGEISLRADDVDCCCASLAEVWAVKSGRVRADWPEDYLALADWSQRNGLLDHAGSARRMRGVSRPAIP